LIWWVGTNGKVIGEGDSVMKLNLGSMRFTLKVFGIGLAFWAGLATTALGQPGQTITRVEEYWEMDVVFAKDDLGAPQIGTLMSPDASSAAYFTFDINCTTSPEPDDGGLQVNAWVGDDAYDYKNPPTDQTLERSREIISWTQVIEMQDDMLVFSIKDFRSRSLGDFANDEQLRVSMPSSLADLSNYSYQHSANESGVPYALNRVNSMTLRSVRMYSGESQVSQVEVNADALND
jgi:hypothetical protein